MKAITYCGKKMAVNVPMWYFRFSEHPVIPISKEWKRIMLTVDADRFKCGVHHEAGYKLLCIDCAMLNGVIW